MNILHVVSPIVTKRLFTKRVAQKWGRGASQNNMVKEKRERGGGVMLLKYTL